jgi:LysM repeat protein
MRPVGPVAPGPIGPGVGGPVYGGPVGGGHGPLMPSLPPVDQSAVCGGPDYVYNGSFEQGFNSTALGDVGKGWGAFTNGGAAVYGFYQEQWDVVVADGKNGQLIEISTKRIYPPDADRYAGIYQRIGGLHPGATYELSLRGLLRGEGNEQEPYRFAAQWGLSQEADWRTVKEWTEMDLGDIYKRTQPGPLALYKARFTAPAPNVVLFIRAWNKWAVTDVELDFNVDAIKVTPCHPGGPSYGGPSHGPVYGGPAVGGPGMGGPVYGGPVGPGMGAPVGASCVYTVKPGDMLSRIAQRYGVTAAAIAQANGIRNQNMIYAGQQLTIPGCGGGPAAGPAMPVAVPVARPAAGPAQVAPAGPARGGPAAQTPAGRPGVMGATSGPTQAGGPAARPVGGPQTTYTVQRGDSLSMIALWYGVDVQRLAAANGIRNANMIYVGQVLVIPGN